MGVICTSSPSPPFASRGPGSDDAPLSQCFVDYPSCPRCFCFYLSELVVLDLGAGELRVSFSMAITNSTYNPCPHAHRPSARAAGLSHARSHLPDRPTRPKRATRPARGHSSSVCPPFTTDPAAPVNPSAAPRPRPPAGPVDLRVGERRIRCPPLAAALSPQPPPPEQSSPTVQNQRALKRPCPSGRSTAPPRQVSRHQGSFGGLGSVVRGLVVAQPSSTGAQ